MGRSLDFRAIIDIVVILMFLGWLLWWTWRGCRADTLARGAINGPPAAKWYQFRWLAVGFLAATIGVLAIPDPARRGIALSYLNSAIVIAHFSIGYMGWFFVRTYRDWRAKQRNI